MSSTTQSDALGYLDDLREAIQSPFIQLLLPAERNVGNSLLAARSEASLRVAEQTPEVCDTAVAVVSALGFCRIYGISVPLDLKTRLSSPLPSELLTPAIYGMLRLLESSTDDARALPSRFDNSEPLEDRSHCTSILHSLMELWAMYIVVDDEYQYSLGKSNDPSFGAWMHRLLDAFSALDTEVQRDEQIRLLSVATELPLLENWRKMLTQPYREHLPWWLDGTLEEAAEEVRQYIETDRTLEPKTIQSWSNALTLLAQRKQEIELQEDYNDLAASSGDVTGPVALEPQAGPARSSQNAFQDCWNMIFNDGPQIDFSNVLTLVEISRKDKISGNELSNTIALSVSGLQTPLQSGPDRSWKRIEISSDQVNWLEGMPIALNNTSLGIDIQWHMHPDPCLKLATDGVFQRGKGFEVMAQWLDADNRVIAQSQPVHDRSQIVLKPPTIREPKEGDWLILRHAKLSFSEGAEKWIAMVRVKF